MFCTRAVESTYLARAHDRVQASGNDRPTTSEDPVLRVGDRHERDDGQEFGEHRKDRYGCLINDCVEVRLKKVGSLSASESTRGRRWREREREREREEEPRTERRRENEAEGGLGGGVQP